VPDDREPACDTWTAATLAAMVAAVCPTAGGVRVPHAMLRESLSLCGLVPRAAADAPVPVPPRAAAAADAAVGCWCGVRAVTGEGLE